MRQSWVRNNRRYPTPIGLGRWWSLHRRMDYQPTTYRNFKPQSLSNTEGEEKSYRRGFDQGITATLYALGLDGDTVSQLHFKQRSAEFREGLQKYPPWNASAKERAEIVDAVLSAATDRRQLGEDEA